MMDIFYEDLAADKNFETNRVLKFLGLKDANLESNHVKQNNQSLSDLISNYSDLKNKFKNTEWEIFFEN